MNYIGSKNLETERLYLHKTEEKDLKDLWNILLLEDVSKYYLTTPIHDNWEEEKKWQYKKLERAGNNDTFTWTIELKEDNSVIGQISVIEKEFEEVKDIGWFLEPGYQNKGYMMEAAETILKYMFLEVGIKIVETSAAIDNPPSWKLMEKLGFKRGKKNIYNKYTFIEDEVECYTYTLTKEDFLKELFRKETLAITKDIDKDPYIKHITDDLVLNITGESGSGKTTATEPYLNDPNCIIIDTDKIFGKEKDTENELYKMFINKYQKLPNLYQEFDIIYKDILEYYKNTNKMIIIDSAQFRNIKDLSILKGDIIVIRTCVNTCFDRCVERYKNNHKDITFEEIAEYQSRKKDIYKWYIHLNNFLYKLDKKD